jgi:hypothetical protein
MCAALTRLFFDILQREWGRGGGQGRRNKDEGKSHILFASLRLRVKILPLTGSLSPTDNDKDAAKRS